MNERIQELWAQCVIKHTKTPMNWQPVADEFAELIVLDLLNMIACEANQYAEPTWAYELLNDIKDRYGVES